MAREDDESSVFDQIRIGLEECIAYMNGEIALKTTRVAPVPPPAAKPRNVVALRSRLGMSQYAFAAALNVSPRTVQSWEQGRRTPSDASLRLLQIFALHPEIVETLYTPDKGPKQAKSPKPAGKRRAAPRSRASA